MDEEERRERAAFYKGIKREADPIGEFIAKLKAWLNSEVKI